MVPLGDGLKWKLDLVRLEIVLVLTQDRCTVCSERTIGSGTVLVHQLELLGYVGHVEYRSVRLEMVLVFMYDRCTVCAKRARGSDIVLDAPNGTPR